MQHKSNLIACLADGGGSMATFLQRQLFNHISLHLANIYIWTLFCFNYLECLKSFLCIPRRQAIKNRIFLIAWPMIYCSRSKRSGIRLKVRLSQKQGEHHGQLFINISSASILLFKWFFFSGTAAEATGFPTWLPLLWGRFLCPPKCHHLLKPFAPFQFLAMDTLAAIKK